jgi:Protein of unknown function (DUF4238)
MSTKRPHFVPRTYLRGWANGDDQVSYRRRGQDHAVITSTTNVAVAGGIYGTGEAAQAREEMFSQIEAEWTSLCTELTEHGDLSGQRRSALAVYMAMQLNRTLISTEGLSFAAKVAATTDERPIPKEAVKQYFLALEGCQPEDNEVEAASDFINGAPGIPTLDEVMAVSMDVAVKSVAPRLEAMKWCVHRYNRPVLMTSDRPVFAWRHQDPGAPPGGVGIETADEVRFPLSPRALLLLTSAKAGSPSRAADHRHQAVNDETGRHCQHFVVATPEGKARLASIGLSAHPPRIRFRRGPLYYNAGDGRSDPMGDIIHTYFDNRAEEPVLQRDSPSDGGS